MDHFEKERYLSYNKRFGNEAELYKKKQLSSKLTTKSEYILFQFPALVSKSKAVYLDTVRINQGQYYPIPQLLYVQTLRDLTDVPSATE